MEIAARITILKIVTLSTNNPSDDDAAISLACAAEVFALIWIVRHQPPLTCIARKSLYNSLTFVIDRVNPIINRSFVGEINYNGVVFVKGRFHAFAANLYGDEIFRIEAFTFDPAAGNTQRASISKVGLRFDPGHACLEL